MFATVIQQFLLRLFRLRCVGGKLYKGFHLLHFIRIRNADHTAHLHIFMCIENVLNLPRINIVSGGNNHALCTTLEVYKPLFIHTAEISGVNPGHTVGMGAERLGSFFGVVHIFPHNGWAGQKNLALFPIGEFPVGSGLHNLDIGIREGPGRFRAPQS